MIFNPGDEIIYNNPKYINIIYPVYDDDGLYITVLIYHLTTMSYQHNKIADRENYILLSEFKRENPELFI